MVWVREVQYKWYEKLVMNILKIGPLPRHIAFILDGNRRFAQESNIPKIEGHSKGFSKLSECLRWCLDMGVQETTAFAFSIENFKRSKEEVDSLMELATEKFRDLLNEEQNLREKGIRVRVIGNISLLPVELQELVAKATLITENNEKLFLNIALSYTSQEEMTNAVQTILEDCGEDLEAGDINEEMVRQCLYTQGGSEPDLLIRTSGETRISDFLMWQISATVLFFTKTLWPALTLWQFLLGIFFYQRSLLSMNHFKRNQLQQQIKSKEYLPERVQNFLCKVDVRRRNALVNLANAKQKKEI